VPIFIVVFLWSLQWKVTGGGFNYCLVVGVVILKFQLDWSVACFSMILTAYH